MMCRWQFQVAIGDSVPKLLLSSTAKQKNMVEFLHFFRSRNCLTNKVKTGFKLIKLIYLIFLVC